MRICFCGALIESYELIQSYVANPQSTTFSQTHSHPFAVRHNLLSAKESASSSYKAAYPFVQGLEFAAVQIIAVDTVRKSDFCKAGHLIKAGHPIQNTVSTGDLNRGRRACPACFLCYFLHVAKSNNPFPFRELSDKQKVCPYRGGTLRVLFGSFCRSKKNKPVLPCKEISRFCKPRIFPERETDCYFLRRAKSNTKSTRGFTLRPRFKSPVETVFWIG